MVERLRARLHRLDEDQQELHHRVLQHRPRHVLVVAARPLDRVLGLLHLEDPLGHVADHLVEQAIRGIGARRNRGPNRLALHQQQAIRRRGSGLGARQRLRVPAPVARRRARAAAGWRNRALPLGGGAGQGRGLVAAQAGIRRRPGHRDRRGRDRQRPGYSDRRGGGQARRGGDRQRPGHSDRRGGDRQRPGHSDRRGGGRARRPLDHPLPRPVPCSRRLAVVQRENPQREEVLVGEVQRGDREQAGAARPIDELLQGPAEAERAKEVHLLREGDQEVHEGGAMETGARHRRGVITDALALVLSHVLVAIARYAVYQARVRGLGEAAAGLRLHLPTQNSTVVSTRQSAERQKRTKRQPAAGSSRS